MKKNVKGDGNLQSSKTFLRASTFTLQDCFFAIPYLPSKSMVMGTVRDIQLSSSKQSVFRDQLVTVADLDAFKTDLLTGIRGLLSDLKERQSKKWLKSYEVKKLLAISNGTLQTLRSNGTLPFTKIGGTIYYNSEDIDKMLLEKQKHLVPGYLPKRKY